MPVLAYGCKGPKDIVQTGRNGYLVDSVEGMATQVVEHFAAPDRHAEMRRAALRRLQDYQPGVILQQFLGDLGLFEPEPELAQRTAA